MDYVKRISILLFGIATISIGASILIVADLGSDAVTILNQGVSTFLNINIGYGILINNAVLFIALLLFNRKQIHIGTVFSALFTPIFVSLFTYLLPESFTNSFVLNLVYSVLALLICSVGLSLYIYSNSGLGPFEGFVDLISKKLKLKFGYTKVIIDVLFFITGYLLGGTFHIASILSIIIIGPLINLFLFLLNKTNFIAKLDEKPTINKEENFNELEQ